MAYGNETMDEGMPGATGPETNPEEQPAPMPEKRGMGDTFFLPPDFAEGHECKPGDKITLEVVGTDEDGDVEVKMAHEGEYGGSKRGEEDWRKDLRSSMKEPAPEPEM